jgi:two-component system response regulator YesN
MLIVDDEATTRKGLMEYISWGEIGVDAVYDAEDGQKGLELASAIHPDIVLTDVRMPRMNGIELAQRLKDMLPLCKVVFLSGYSDKEYLLSAINLQAVNYIEKPVDLEEVRRVIQKTVALCIEDRQRLDQTRENLCLDIIRHKDAPDKIRSRLRKNAYQPSGRSPGDLYRL